MPPLIGGGSRAPALHSAAPARSLLSAPLHPFRAPPPPASPPALPAQGQVSAKPAKYDGIEGANARRLKALGEAEVWAVACAAKGGSISPYAAGAHIASEESLECGTCRSSRTHGTRKTRSGDRQ